MESEKQTGIIHLMNELEEMEKYIGNCAYIDFAQRKRWARICREAINKFAVILDFIRSFLPNFMREKEEKK
jgi:hypothetical protein